MIGHKIAQSLNQEFDLYMSSRKKINIDDIRVKNGKICHHDFLVHNNGT